MKRFSSTRRVLSVVAAVVAGLASTAILAAPANAVSVDTHTVTVAGSYQCQPDGTWKVHWTVTNNSVSDKAEITSVALTPSGTTVSNIVVGAKIDEDSGTVAGDQIVPGSESSASLGVGVKWVVPGHDDFTFVSEVKGVKFEGTCAPLYTVTQDCNGITFTFKAPPPPPVLTLGGPKMHLVAAVTDPTVTLHPSTGSDVVFTLPLPAGGADKVVTFPGSPGLTVTITIDPPGFMKTYPWTSEPCLPTTGSSVTGPVAIGAGLLAAGIGLIALLFAVRRRRTIASH